VQPLPEKQEQEIRHHGGNEGLCGTLYKRVKVLFLSASNPPQNSPHFSIQHHIIDAYLTKVFFQSHMKKKIVLRRRRDHKKS
jgi:hypothetical protein